MSSLSLADQLNHSIEALLAHSNPGLPATDRSMTELLEIAAELRLLPRRDFKARLKADLLQRALAAPALPTRANTRPPERVLEWTKRRNAAAAHSDILPTLFGMGYGNYPVQRGNFLLSLLAIPKSHATNGRPRHWYRTIPASAWWKTSAVRSSASSRLPTRCAR